MHTRMFTHVMLQKQITERIYYTKVPKTYIWPTERLCTYTKVLFSDDIRIRLDDVSVER